MKRVLSVVIFLLCVICGSEIANAYNFDEIYNSEQAVYNYETGLWSRYQKTPTVMKNKDENDVEEEPVVEPTIVFTKKTSAGSGSYSKYYYDKKAPALLLNSNYEFIQDGRLIAVDNANLKYYELIYYDGQFREVPLSDSQLKIIFDNAQIVNISEFEDDKFTTTKSLFGIKKILLVNDTDRSFYKYSYKPPKVQQTDVKGFITTPKCAKIIFSHYGDKDGALEINIIRK